jgi:hypothetical protein
MRTIQMRDGRWFTFTNRHGERIVTVAEPDDTAEAYASEIGVEKVVASEGTGVRVVDGNDNEIEGWVVRARREGAIELANLLLDKYRDE